jgi:hypothetical protein
MKDDIDGLVVDAALRIARRDPPSTPSGIGGALNTVHKKTIDRCYHKCLYFSLDGGSGPVMRCEYLEAPERGFIISHSEYDNGFSGRCPLADKIRRA